MPSQLVRRRLLSAVVLLSCTPRLGSDPHFYFRSLVFYVFFFVIKLHTGVSLCSRYLLPLGFSHPQKITLHIHNGWPILSAKIYLAWDLVKD